MDWRVAADMAIGAGVPLCAAGLAAAGLVTRREVLFLLLGVLIGLVFEFFIGLTPGFIVFKLEWPLRREAILVCHSLWDGGLFMAGYALAGFVLRRPREALCRAGDWRELAVMTAWGAASAFAVELIGNGPIWEYQPVGWNPVWITVGGQGYRVFIQLVWLVAPGVFYLGCVGISKTEEKRIQKFKCSKVQR